MISALFAAVVEWCRHRLCGILHGHDTFLAYDHDRIFLRCVSCGYETPGWDVAHRLN